jgi:hypothetical protein
MLPKQPAAEQQRLLKVLVERATWKAGELETKRHFKNSDYRTTQP